MLTLRSGIKSGPQGKVSRRDLLQIGSLSALGISLPQWLASQDAQGANRKGREVNCILLWLLGGPSHIDMYDLKPDAPAEIRGELNPIQTCTPGLEFGELMPNLAKCADQFSLIRSMTSPDPTHGRADHYLMSGSRHTKEMVPASFGSILTWQQERNKARTTPPYVHVGEMKSTNYGKQGRAGYLGPTYDPFVVQQEPQSSSFRVDTFSRNESISVDRLSDRRSLLTAVDQFQANTEQQLNISKAKDAYTERAFSMLTASKAKDAFDISQESDATRDAYGRNRVGQGLLLARRLVEAGVRFVTVKGYVRYGWDHHPEVFPRLRMEVPPYDQGYAALLKDLADRGMTENTLVITAGEFGRTPRLNTDARGPGRDHWNKAFSLTMGGGGIKTGVVLGATDKHAAEVTERPVTVEDYAATVYHTLGMDPKGIGYTLGGRPMPALPEGKVIPELLGS